MLPQALDIWYTICYFNATKFGVELKIRPMMASSIASLLNMPVNSPVKLERTLLKAQVVNLLRSQIISHTMTPQRCEEGRATA